MKKKILYIFGALIVLLSMLELYLRFYWGFCDSVLMMYSPNYEYIAQPNQDRFRFRKHIHYNSVSMRSEEIDTSALTILGFGDSIFNGGVQVDQDSIASSILSRDLSKKLGTKTQVLNISAGSWGPDNCFAYLQEKGDFAAEMIFLVVSSHDAYDVMDFNPVIDKIDRYESKQYKLGLWEFINKYLIPKLLNKTTSDLTGIPDKSNKFNPGFKNFVDYGDAKNKPFFIYLNPDTTEVNKRRYHKAGEKIVEFCKENNIECIQGITSATLDDYRGIIHLNEKGQKKMASKLMKAILDRKQCLNKSKAER